MTVIANSKDIFRQSRLAELLYLILGVIMLGIAGALLEEFPIVSRIIVYTVAIYLIVATILKIYEAINAFRKKSE